MKVTALLLIAIVCVSSKNFRSVQGRTQTMTSLAQVPPNRPPHIHLF